MATHIVLVPAGGDLGRKFCEQIEDLTFKSEIEFLDEYQDEKLSLQLYPLTDFMDAVNDQEIDDLSRHFITYITIKN